MKLIIGLGNPGKTYAKTRHNIGFIVLNELREKMAEYGAGKWELSKKFNAEVCGAVRGGQKIILAKPMTFMNNSGETAQLLAHFYKIILPDLIVVHDDKDLLLGDIRVQNNRSDAGHNGIKSIVQHLGTQNFTRLRIGIASENPKKMRDTAEFVLSKFGLFEKRKVDEVVERAVEEIMKIT